MHAVVSLPQGCGLPQRLLLGIVELLWILELEIWIFPIGPSPENSEAPGQTFALANTGRSLMIGA